MTWFPSAACACGRPWEEHQLRCPRPERQGAGRVVALAVSGGVAVQVLFIVAIVFAAGLISPPPRSIGWPGPQYAVAGPVQPRVQACELFYAWEKTRHRGLLTRAVADAGSSRVPWKFKQHFRTDLNGLRRWTREGARSSRAIGFEHAVQDNCKRIRADLTWRHRPAFRNAIARFSRPGAASGRPAGAGCTSATTARIRPSGGCWPHGT